MHARDMSSTPIDDNPMWYKDAIIYQLHVRAFFDSNADGIGDFPGLVEKLDYIQDLGVTAIWLLPFYPSPLRDDGYDIADYSNVHPSYGMVRDIRRLVREAHRRGLRVITELVCNHTSDQHEWFQRARRSKPGSSNRDFYVWSDTPEKYRDARIIFKDYETSNWSWDPVAQAYYWHRFYHHQPDLNFENPRVRNAIFSAMEFWLKMGIDGLRLDAIPYLYEREGTNCENLPETHEFLKSLRVRIDERFDDRMLLAEANQWPEDAVAYFGDGDECHMSFHFPLMPRMFMAVRMEDRYPIIDILAQTPEIPDNTQWALFLRNHDELTLEMVTDEERDYMYRVYAHDPQMRINLGIRRRLAPLLNNNRRRIELMNGLLFALPGTPIIYYGDEIGMGDNIYLGDRNGVRTPMQWNADRNAGFSEAMRQRLFLPVIVDAEYHYEAINVEAQQNNPHSLLWWMKRLIALRKRYQAFGRGTLEFLHPDNRKVLSFIRRHEDEQILVVANLSRFAQAVELDLSELRGMVPVEMFGRTEFPPIGELPYFITLGPHSFYWFAIEPQHVEGRPATAGDVGTLPRLTAPSGWESLVTGKGKSALQDVLPAYIRERRWFGGKARRITRVSVQDAVPLPFDGRPAFITIVQVDYTEGDPEQYVLPMAFTDTDWADSLIHDHPHLVIARVDIRNPSTSGVLYDPITDAGFARALLSTIRGRRRIKGGGEISGTPSTALRRITASPDANLEPGIIRGEQSNSSITFGDAFILKLFRKLEPGINPDLEIGRFLTERRFQHTPPVAGTLEYQPGSTTPATLGILQSYVENEGDAWTFTLDAIGRYYDRAVSSAAEIEEDIPAVSTHVLLDLTDGEIPERAYERIGSYLEEASLLGRRTAEMHCILASGGGNPSFATEPFSTFYQRSIYQSMRTLANRVFQTVRRNASRLPESVHDEVQAVLQVEDEILRRYRSLVDRKIDAVRIRCHGDYHLGQVLYTGKDFAIIDFEGEPARSLSERRLKRSPLVDVAGMLRSFHYAAFGALADGFGDGIVREEDTARVEPWAHYWNLWVNVAFLKAYLEVTRNEEFIPSSREQLEVLLDAYLLDKAIYELGYELNNRPSWVGIPLRGVLQLAGS